MTEPRGQVDALVVRPGAWLGPIAARYELIAILACRAAGAAG